MSPSRLERQTACSMHFDLKGQRPFGIRRCHPLETLPRRLGENRQLPFLLREERGTKKRKRDRLGPFSNPHEVPMQEAVRNHRACKSPCGEFVRGGSVSSQRACPKQSAPWSPLNFPLPLCKRWLGIIFSVAWARFRLRGNEESFLLFYSWRIHKGPSRSLMRIFAYFLFGRK